jgi:hypothetical protein
VNVGGALSFEEGEAEAPPAAPPETLARRDSEAVEDSEACAESVQERDGERDALGEGENRGEEEGEREGIGLALPRPPLDVEGEVESEEEAESLGCARETVGASAVAL